MNDAVLPYGLLASEARAQQERFNVGIDQVQHDFAISAVLSVLAEHAADFVFHGGTALGRTILDGLRLSEDIDLIAIGSRAHVARRLDGALRDGLARRFGPVGATPSLSDAKRDTAPCTYRIGESNVQIQLLDPRGYPAWPTTEVTVAPRYSAFAAVSLNTLTPPAFVCAKTIAWCDRTRNAPRDLYDLWALARGGYLNPEAAGLYAKLGPTGRPLKPAALPSSPPSSDAWHDALSHQCRPRVGPEQAYKEVVDAWLQAISTPLPRE